MPNHVAVEVIFRNVSKVVQKRILALACNKKGEVDFEVLLPIPLNCWMGGVSQRHRKTFPDNALDWCTKHWSTKWGAYQQKNPVERTKNSITLRFTTAWRPPMGWIVALYNKLRLPMEYNWLSEGETRGHSGSFSGKEDDFNEWQESECDEEMQKHLHMLRWGCESFPDDDDEEEIASAPLPREEPTK
jgi:hypothetical protein